MSSSMGIKEETAGQAQVRKHFQRKTLNYTSLPANWLPILATKIQNLWSIWVRLNKMEMITK